MTSAQSTDFSSRAERVSSLVNAAKRLLEDGKTIELAALTGHVEELCKYVQENPDTETSSQKESLLSIMDSLDELENRMTERHEELTKSQEKSTLSRAMKAYGATEEDKS